MMKTFWTWTGDLERAPKVVTAKTPHEAADKALDGFSEDAKVLVVEPWLGAGPLRSWTYRLELQPTVVLLSAQNDEPPPAIRYAHPEPPPAPSSAFPAPESVGLPPLRSDLEKAAAKARAAEPKLVVGVVSNAWRATDG